MKITLEQLFYGRSERGYGILGSSPGGRVLAARIESLCGAVGTPGADYDGEPILLSVPVGNRIVMLCGRRGEPDSIGRATLFFHALVADKTELSSAGADAFSLFSQGAFLGKMPAEEIDVLCIDIAQRRAEAKATSFDVTFPCVIRSAKPAPEVTRGVVGENTRDRSWATFAFQPMPDFDVQILPPQVSCPRDLNEYDAAGRLVCSAALSNGCAKDEIPQKRSNEPPRHPIEKIVDVPSKNKSSAMFKLSLFVNVVLIVVCLVPLASRKTNLFSQGTSTDQIVATNPINGSEKTDPVKLTATQKSAIEEAAIKRHISELKGLFPKEMEIPDFEAEAKELPKYADIYDPTFSDTYKKPKTVLDKLRFYVDFVNKNLLKGKTP